MKLLANLLLLTALVALAIVLTGNTVAVRNLIAKKGTNVSSPSSSATTRTQGVPSSQKFNALYGAAKLELFSNPNDTSQQMSKVLRAKEPAYKTGLPISKGGIQDRKSVV